MGPSCRCRALQPRGLRLPGWIVLVAALALAPAARAQTAWEGIRAQLFGERAIAPAGETIRLEAPTRPENQSFVPIAMQADLRDGRTIKTVTFIIDENPAPVAARFTIGGNRHSLALAGRFRLNRASDVRAVVELSDGSLLMASRFVKFAGGQAACSAPPTGDPETIAASMGNMTLEPDGAPELVPEQVPAAAAPHSPKATLKISHPNHTGMVLDQISLLYIPMRIVSDVEIRDGDELVFAMEGSIALSQNPEITFDVPPGGAHAMTVRVTDSDETVWQKRFDLGPGS